MREEGSLTTSKVSSPTAGAGAERSGQARSLARRPHRTVPLAVVAEPVEPHKDIGQLSPDPSRRSPRPRGWPIGLSFGEPLMAIPEMILGELIERARSASDHAYCPYSHFRVGAAVLTEGGEIFTGCNVENASYGLTICAERNALFHAVSRGKTRLEAVVVYTPTPMPSAPCGACRQVINEFGPDAEIISVCNGPDILRKPLSQLMPDAFGPHNLE